MSTTSNHAFNKRPLYIRGHFYSVSRTLLGNPYQEKHHHLLGYKSTQCKVLKLDVGSGPVVRLTESWLNGLGS